ncbi:MAG TPA: hypothetical protein VKF42_09840 [Chitinivibrionales bacterium]|nr:hypothetical protein [Chitinivibrionales bacterium]
MENNKTPPKLKPEPPPAPPEHIAIDPDYDFEAIAKRFTSLETRVAELERAQERREEIAMGEDA